MKKFQQILTLALSLGFIAVFAAWFLLLPDAEESITERRHLAKCPPLSLSSVANGSFMNGFEKYMLDQFPLRGGFRTLKAAANAGVFMQKDNNRLYSVGEHLSKLDFPTDFDSVDRAAQRFRYVYDAYLRNGGTKTYLSVIPDKNFFIASPNGYPDKDYRALVERLGKGFPEAKYIDVSGLLSADDFYYTDLHWRQERILKVADEIADKMGAERIGQCEKHDAGISFYGVYYGQAALPHAPESLSYLDNSVIRGLKVYNVETSSDIPVYDLSAAAGRDPYEMFLGGARSIIRITNPNAAKERRLIVFRDSFCSSIAPLLTAGYSEITLVDIRYISPSALGKLIDFTKADDALFLYSASVINNSETIK
mgnify:FL=1